MAVSQLEEVATLSSGILDEMERAVVGKREALELVLTAFLQCSSEAADYPDRPVKIVVPVPAGGTADAIPRLVADWLSRKWRQPVIVDNRTGAAGNRTAGAIGPGNGTSGASWRRSIT